MENRCVCCGDIINEGQQVCLVCELKQEEHVTPEQVECLVKVVQKIADTLIEIWQSIVDSVNTIIKYLYKCLNKRIVHLALHGQKYRTRKKNLRRIYYPLLILSRNG